MLAGRSPCHVSVRRSPGLDELELHEPRIRIEVEPRSRAERIGVERLVEAIAVGRVELEAMRRVAFADLRDARDPAAGLIAVLDALALGVGDRGQQPEGRVRIPRARPALRDFEGALRNAELADAFHTNSARRPLRASLTLSGRPLASSAIW